MQLWSYVPLAMVVLANRGAAAQSTYFCPYNGRFPGEDVDRKRPFESDHAIVQCSHAYR